MAGHVGGMIEFPKWLGKYSRQNKFDRILQELQVSKNWNVIGPSLNNDIPMLSEKPFVLLTHL